MAQRLGRRLCESCKSEEDLPQAALLEEGFTQEDVDEGITLYKAVGCNKCAGGYKGRVGVYQVMPISEAMSRIIMENGTSVELADQAAKEGVSDLRRSGLRKVKAGILSLEELNRITKE
ncbi:MAG: hypothetical protein KZQ58_09980 [gamma proteobacterium symbiont of Bathyaustriella thionipta]|nr:hypothetical protein [gamma proteobacterium symbiont of Bathyaustriella thionipta]